MERVLRRTNTDDISRNQLTRLPHLLFRSNKTSHTLEALFLQRNRLNYLPRNMFQGLKKLKFVCLSFNNINGVADGAFAGTKLQHIYLYGNNITILENSSFINEKDQEIHLYANPLVRVRNTTFKEWEGTNISLYLSCDSIEEIQRTHVGIKCVTPTFVPTMVVNYLIVGALQREGFYCTTFLGETSECAPCPRGTYGDGLGGCSPCPPGGYYQDYIGILIDDPNKMVCKQCPNGTFAKFGNAYSVEDCVICPDGTNKKKHAGFRACYCLDGFSRTDRFGACTLCLDEGTNCTGKDYKTIKNGYFWNWDFRNASKAHYKRFIANLKNETRYFTNSTLLMQYNMEIPKVFKCPRFDSCVASPGGVDVACAEEYRGWLCSKCKKDFYSIFNNCLPCPKKLFLFIEAVVVLSGCIGIYLIVLLQYKKRKNCSGDRRSFVDLLISRGKIILGFYQVVGEFFISLHDISWTGKLYIIGESLSILEMNILRVFIRPQCFDEHLFIDPKVEFLIGIIFVIVVIFLGLIIYCIKAIAYRRNRSPSTEVQDVTAYQNDVKSKILGFVIIMLFLTYPPICKSIFQLYPRACETYCFDEKDKECITVLRSDYDINCEHLLFYQCSAYIVTFLYIIAFPTVLFLLLKKYAYDSSSLLRFWATKPHSAAHRTGRERQTNQKREKIPMWLDFLCENYKSQFWYWEILELTRKIAQTVLVTLLGWENKFTVLMTILISVLYLLLHARYLPMKSKSEQRLQMFSLTAILINVVVAAMNVPQEYSNVLNTFLIILNIVVLAIIAGEVFVGIFLLIKRSGLNKVITRIFQRSRQWLLQLREK